MTNKEVVERLTKVHESLDNLHEIINAIDVAIFDLALEFTNTEDFPHMSKAELEDMKDAMRELKKCLYDEKHEEESECCCDDCSEIPACMIPDIGDRVIMLGYDGIESTMTEWVFENIKDKGLVVRYAYGVTPVDYDWTDVPLTVVGYDSDKSHYYVHNEVEDECYIVKSDCIAKYVTGEEALYMIEKLL